jgi:hypothetical protein
MALQIGGIVKVCSLRFGMRMLGVSPGNWSRVLSVMMAVSGVARSVILWLMGVGSSAANTDAMKSVGMQEHLFYDDVSCSVWDLLCHDCLEFIASDPFVDIDQFLD